MQEMVRYCSVCRREVAHFHDNQTGITTCYKCGRRTQYVVVWPLAKDHPLVRYPNTILRR